MSAYNFQKQFATLVETGQKRQTIELKLLPCYKCGGIATHRHYDKYTKGLEPLIIDGKIIREGKVWHFVKCEECAEQRTSLHPKCSVEAIKEWNALPRALTWTTEPPKVTGFFWAIPKNVVQNWTVIKVIDKNGTLLACPAGNPFAHDLSNFRFWAGPIPEPKDPTS